MKKVIGIDLGGTNIDAGIIDENGKILKRVHKDNFATNGKVDVLNIISEIIDKLLREDVIGIGIGSPGFIDSNTGRVLKIGGNIKDWANTDIKGELNTRFPTIPIFVENDANVAALCEYWIGAAQGLNNFIMVTLGTGVGGAIYIKEHGILKGKNYQAAELGHVILYPFGVKCNCGQSGCVEKYISGTAIERIYKEKSGKFKKGKDIFKDKEDKTSQEVIDGFIKDLSIFLVNLKNIFDPEAIIIGGGVINSKQYWWEDTIRKYKSFSNDSNTMEIIPAKYLNDSGLIGAAKLVFDQYQNIRLKL